MAIKRMLRVVANLQLLAAVTVSVLTAVFSQENARSVHLLTLTLQTLLGHASINIIARIVKTVIAITSMVPVLIVFLGMQNVLGFVNLSRTALLSVPRVTWQLVCVWLAFRDSGPVKLVSVLKQRTAHKTATLVTIAPAFA